MSLKENFGSINKLKVAIKKEEYKNESFLFTIREEINDRETNNIKELIIE